MRLTDTGMINDDGTRPVPYPFQVWSWLGGWKPICIKHKLLFMRRRLIGEHLYCNFDPKDCPSSDYAKHLSGYKRVWL